MPSRPHRNPSRLSLADTITAAIIARLEAGVKPWVRPWRSVSGGRPLRACGIPYQGINVFWLWLVADTRGFASPYWMTYHQAAEQGGQVRRGETASTAVFYKSYLASAGHDPIDTASENDDCELRRVLRAFAVFNADQIDGLPARFHPVALREEAEPEGRRSELDHFFAAIPAAVRHHGDQAYYEPGADRITMPNPRLFAGYDHYYATLAHELSHWTGHSTRLARDFAHRFGTAAYAGEELVAELSSAMIGAELGLPVAHLDSHASYIDHWLALLKSDNRAILTAAARAEEASRFLLRLGSREAAEVGERAPGQDMPASDAATPAGA